MKILFLGDNGHHKPQERYRQIEPVLASHGIRVEYADTAQALNAETLARFDGLLVYANLEKITPEQEKALDAAFKHSLQRFEAGVLLVEGKIVAEQDTAACREPQQSQQMGQARNVLAMDLD